METFKAQTLLVSSIGRTTSNSQQPPKYNCQVILKKNSIGNSKNNCSQTKFGKTIQNFNGKLLSLGYSVWLHCDNEMYLFSSVNNFFFSILQKKIRFSAWFKFSFKKGICQRLSIKRKQMFAKVKDFFLTNIFFPTWSSYLPASSFWKEICQECW